MYKLLMAVLITGIICSCNKYSRDCPDKAYYELSASVQLWFPYGGNQDLIFSDLNGVQDTLLLRNFLLGDDYTGGVECVAKTQFVRANIIDIKSNDSIKIELASSERISIQQKSTSIYYYDSRKIVVNPGIYRRFETTITLNGHVYYDVLAVECSTADNCIATGITKYYYAKGKGLAGFERNGILWTVKE